MNNQDYKTFCNQTPNLPFYYQEWWLNAIYNNDWNCIIYKEGEEIKIIKEKNIDGSDW